MFEGFVRSLPFPVLPADQFRAWDAHGEGQVSSLTPLDKAAKGTTQPPCGGATDNETFPWTLCCLETPRFPVLSCQRPAGPAESRESQAGITVIEHITELPFQGIIHPIQLHSPPAPPQLSRDPRTGPSCLSCHLPALSCSTVFVITASPSPPKGAGAPFISASLSLFTLLACLLHWQDMKKPQKSNSI